MDNYSRDEILSALTSFVMKEFCQDVAKKETAFKVCKEEKDDGSDPDDPDAQWRKIL